jgi:hypothetical protein
MCRSEGLLLFQSSIVAAFDGIKNGCLKVSLAVTIYLSTAVSNDNTILQIDIPSTAL